MFARGAKGSRVACSSLYFEAPERIDCSRQSGYNRRLTPFIKYLLGTIISDYRDFEDPVDIADQKADPVVFFMSATVD